jgi:hypothetical protein
MPELLKECRIKNQSKHARNAAKLMGGTVIALLIDDLDPSYYGLRFAVPSAPSKHNRGMTDKTIRYYDVWILASDDAESTAGYLDIVDQEAQKYVMSTQKEGAEYEYDPTSAGGLVQE